MLITLLAWALRLGMTAFFIGLTAAPDPRDGLDQMDYDLFAYRLSIGEGYTLEDGTPTARRAPGTSLILLPIYLLCGRSYLAAHVWITFLSALTCLLGAELLRNKWGHGAALGAATALALHPGMTYYAMFLLSEAPFTFIAVLGTWLTVRSLERMDQSPRWTAAAGLAWGMAILLRPQAVLMVPIAMLVWWWSGVRRRDFFWPLAIQAVLALLLTMPWVVRNAVVMHKPCFATVVGGITFWGAHNQLTFTDPQVRGDWIGLSQLDDGVRAWPEGEIEQEAIWWKYAFEDIRKHSRLMPQLLLAKVWRFVLPTENTPNRLVFWAFAVAWILTIPGLLLGWPELQKHHPLLAGTFAVQLIATFMCVLIFYGGGRFRHVHEPLFMAVSAIGMRRRFLTSARIPLPSILCEENAADSPTGAEFLATIPAH